MKAREYGSNGLYEGERPSLFNAHYKNMEIHSLIHTQKVDLTGKEEKNVNRTSIPFAC